MGRRRTWMIVLGIIALVLCVPLLLGGIVLAAIFGTDGTYTTGVRGGSDCTTGSTLSSSGHAIVSAAADLGSDSPVGQDMAGVRLLLDLTSANDKPLFVGVAPAGRVTQYLNGANVTRIDDVELSPFSCRALEVPGTAVPARPDQQTFWVAKAVGTGEQNISWRLRTGTYQVVVMNADGSAGVAVTGSVGVKIPWIFWVALGLIIAGVLLLAGGVLLVVFGAKRRPLAGAGPGSAVPVGYSPVPGSGLPPPAGPSATQAWSPPPSAPAPAPPAPAPPAPPASAETPPGQPLPPPQV